MRLQTGQIVGKKLGDKELEAVECRSALEKKKKKTSERQREEREGETYEKRKQFVFQIVDV